MSINLKDYIRDVPDFPGKGIIFKDISPLLASPKVFHTTILLMAENIRDADVIVGLDARGFIFGASLAHYTGLPFCMVRKSGKLPYTTHSQSYTLEYGSNTFEIHTDAINPGQKVAIVDDVLATGGSLNATVKLVERAGGQVISIQTLIEIESLSGKEKIQNYNFHSLLRY